MKKNKIKSRHVTKNREDGRDERVAVSDAWAIGGIGPRSCACWKMACPERVEFPDRMEGSRRTTTITYRTTSRASPGARLTTDISPLTPLTLLLMIHRRPETPLFFLPLSRILAYRFPIAFLHRWVSQALPIFVLSFFLFFRERYPSNGSNVSLLKKKFTNIFFVLAFVISSHMCQCREINETNFEKREGSGCMILQWDLTSKWLCMHIRWLRLYPCVRVCMRMGNHAVCIYAGTLGDEIEHTVWWFSSSRDGQDGGRFYRDAIGLRQTPSCARICHAFTLRQQKMPWLQELLTSFHYDTINTRILGNGHNYIK